MYCYRVPITRTCCTGYRHAVAQYVYNRVRPALSANDDIYFNCGMTMSIIISCALISGMTYQLYRKNLITEQHKRVQFY